MKYCRCPCLVDSLLSEAATRVRFPGWVREFNLCSFNELVPFVLSCSYLVVTLTFCLPQIQGGLPLYICLMFGP